MTAGRPRAPRRRRRGLIRSAPSQGIARPTSGPTSPPTTIPTRVSQSSPITTAHITPAAAAATSRRPLVRPTARPAIAAGKTMSRPEHSRVGDELAAQHAQDRGQVPGDERRADRGEPVAGRINPSQPPEVDAGQGERLVGQEMGHHHPFEERLGPQPGRQRGGVQEVAGIDQGGQDHDRRPGEARRDHPAAANWLAPAKTITEKAIASIGEKPAERAVRPKTRPKPEAEATRPMPSTASRRRAARRIGRIEGRQAALGRARRGQRLGQRRNVLAQVPSHTT